MTHLLHFIALCIGYSIEGLIALLVLAMIVGNLVASRTVWDD